MKKRSDVKTGWVYRHYKGDLYYIDAVSLVTTDGKEDIMICYDALDPAKRAKVLSDVNTYCRTQSDFFATLEYEGKYVVRFVELDFMIGFPPEQGTLVYE